MGEELTRHPRPGMRVTRDHQTIRRWVLARGAEPARVRGSDGVGLRFGPLSATLVPTSWEEFFRRFDEGQMIFHYDPDAASRRCHIERPLKEGDEDD